jgi:hypothetical protein
MIQNKRIQLGTRKQRREEGGSKESTNDIKCGATSLFTIF